MNAENLNNTRKELSKAENSSSIVSINDDLKELQNEIKKLINKLKVYKNERERSLRVLQFIDLEDTSDISSIFKDQLETIVNKVEEANLLKEKWENEQSELVEELSSRINNLEFYNASEWRKSVRKSFSIETYG